MTVSLTGHNSSPSDDGRGDNEAGAASSEGRFRPRQRSGVASARRVGVQEATTAPTTTTGSPSPTRDASSRDYWRRVRSLSRETRQRQE